MIEYLTLEALEHLLQERFKEGFLSLKDLPHPSTFKDMDIATERIVRAVKNHEKITVVGDYDVDGVTATTLMKLFFEEIDYPVTWIIPNRFRDGYGLSSSVVPRLEGTDLAITVDNGIAAVDAAQMCKEKGIDLIITDHHLLPPKLPEAYAIIDQKQPECSFPYEEVCGAQIAWYLIASLKNALGIKIDMMPYMELAAVAIIADMMPLRHINRAMVIAGLKSLSKSNRPAIRAYREYTQKEYFSAEDIGFFLAPLLNSAGRMEDASYAVSFLSSKNIYDARVRLERLIDFNEARKATETAITKEVLACAKDRSVIVVSGESWHEGVVGIVAARVARIFKRPCIVLSDNGNGMLKGSGRSFGTCDLFALVSQTRPLLEKFGGHAAAIGLSLCKKNLSVFKEKLHILGTSLQKEEELFFDTSIVGELHFRDITFALTSLLKKFEPYGQGNETPKFLTKGVCIASVSKMGKEGNHLRFSFEQEGIVHQGVQFKTEKNYVEGMVVDIVYSVNENSFRGNTTLQLFIEEIVECSL
ncbi:Single-stranded-DNA-specific exonuclease RecJ [hydrothermal vent metagenome]|uniref:Single-stranded-DNA-specific exonuclease RecJ n=1 Tax=hydrothermal vent metagenome TaxID=652676 RepID=A0A1W1E9M1_9ZZZZ